MNETLYEKLDKKLDKLVKNRQRERQITASYYHFSHTKVTFHRDEHNILALGFQ
jgi:hypothetical protein